MSSDRGLPRVLVVDDEAPLRELVVVTLGDAFACVEAEDGEAALELARSEPPDLVFLDVMLPGLSGLDVLRALRADPALESVPVIVLSAWQAPDDVTRAIEAGADRFVSKPFDVEALAAAAHDLLDGSG